MRWSAYALVISSTVLLSACQANPLDPGSLSSSWLTASVQGRTIDGPLSTDYVGSGYFMTTPNRRRPAAPALFMLQSEGTGSASDDGFQLWRTGNAIPEPGVYPLSSTAAPGTFAMVFTQRRGNVTYQYGAQSGELHISGASLDHIVGSFSFTGVFTGTCTTGSGATSWVSCTPAPAPDEVEAVLVVSGSFEAARSQ